MKQAALSAFDITWLPVLGLSLFIICFVTYVFFTYRKSNKEFYEEAALIPLEDEHLISEKHDEKR